MCRSNKKYLFLYTLCTIWTEFVLDKFTNESRLDLERGLPQCGRPLGVRNL